MTTTHAPIVLADGRRLNYRERIPVAGGLIDLQRVSSFRAATREGWPLTGEHGSRWVLMVPFLEAQCIPFEIATDQPERS